MERKPAVKRMALLMAFMLACMTVFVTPNTAEAAAPKTKKITLSAKSKTLYVGKSFTLKVKKVTPKKASKKVTYKTSNKKVATVSKKGKVTGKKAGSAKITVTSKANKKAKAVCKVTVKQQIKSIKVTNAPNGTITLDKGKTITLATTISPKNPSNKKLTFSSSKADVASVDSNGVVTAKAAGTANITVAAADKQGAKAIVTVTVKDSAPTPPATVAVTGVTLNKTTLALEEGASETLTATVAPSNATNKTVTWKSSNTAAATVDNAGKVTAVAAGTADITATAGGKTATCKVTVSQKTPEGPVAVTGVTLDKNTLALGVGQTGTLTATVAPSNATNKNVTWSSSDETVATVSNGTVTAVKVGTATVTATTEDGNKTATCAVTVAEASASDVVFPDITLAVNGEQTVTPQYTGVSPVGGIQTVKYRIVATGDQTKQDAVESDVIALEWTPETPDGAAYSSFEVKIKGLKAGTAYVQVELNVDNASGPTSNPIYATMKVTVSDGGTTPEDPKVTAIALNKTTTTLKKGATETFKATVTADDGADKTVTWSSSDPTVATVNNGVVTAVKAGTTTITASAGGKNATCIVTVTEDTQTPENPVEVAGIALNKVILTLKVGETETLTATVSPDNAADETVTWTTSSPQIVTVDDGTVKAVATGTATITATAGGKTATCEVTVGDTNSFGITLADISLKVNGEEEIEPVYVGDFGDKMIHTVVYKIVATDAQTRQDGIGTAQAVEGGETISTDTIQLTWAKSQYGNATAPNQKATIKGLKAGTAYVQVELNVDSSNAPTDNPIFATMKVTVTEE